MTTGPDTRKHADQLREYLTALAAGIHTATHPDTRRPRTSDTTTVLATAGLIRWSGAPKNPGWHPTAEGQTILNHFTRR